MKEILVTFIVSFMLPHKTDLMFNENSSFVEV